MDLHKFLILSGTKNNHKPYLSSLATKQPIVIDNSRLSRWKGFPFYMLDHEPCFWQDAKAFLFTCQLNEPCVYQCLYDMHRWLKRRACYDLYICRNRLYITSLIVKNFMKWNLSSRWLWYWLACSRCKSCWSSDTLLGCVVGH